MNRFLQKGSDLVKKFSFTNFYSIIHKIQIVSLFFPLISIDRLSTMQKRKEGRGAT